MREIIHGKHGKSTDHQTRANYGGSPYNSFKNGKAEVEKPECWDTGGDQSKPPPWHLNNNNNIGRLKPSHSLTEIPA